MTQSSHLPNDLAPCVGSARTGQARPAVRRGVLLLVVLSMLTLFMMLGVAYLLAASRAKEAARAFSRLGLAGEASGLSPQRALEDVLLTVIRDRAATGKRPRRLGGSETFKFESLLSDRYGRTLSAAAGDGRRLEGTVANVTVAGPLIGATFVSSGAMPSNFASLNGRILTFLPANCRPTSHRIIRADADGGSTSLWLSPSLGPAPFKAPPNGTEVVINGREFSAAPAATPITDTDNENEAWDGFGDAGNAHDLWLAHVEPATISTSTCVRPSYFAAMPLPNAAYGYDATEDLNNNGTLDPGEDTNGNGLLDAQDGIPDTCDNDGDGVDDGVFLDFGLPDAINPAGEKVRTHASVLIVDLDGRFNVNAHGSLAPVIYGSSHTQWNTAVNGLADAPLGSGYGPAEITANLATGLTGKRGSGSRLFESTALQSGELPHVALMTGAISNNQSGERATSGSRFTAGTPTPQLPAVEGKYGEKALNTTTTLSTSTALTDGPPGSGNFRLARPGRAKDSVIGAADSLDSRETEQDRLVPPRTDANYAINPDWGSPPNFGVPPTWWNKSADFEWGEAVSGGPLPRSAFNSPPDLHGRMKTLTLSGTTADSAADRVYNTVPHLTFSKPEWATNGAGTRFAEVTDDPYDMRLDSFVSRGGRLHDPATDGTNDPEYGLNLSVQSRDNPFTLAELEAVLRPYDIDTKLTPHRLAAILGSAAEEMRLRVTTDSWDTTAIVGGTAAGQHSAAQRLGNFVNSLSAADTYGSTSMGDHTRPISGGIAHEVSRGERFDLNRPLAGAESKPNIYGDDDNDPDTPRPFAQTPYYLQRQAYCKDLYTLATACARKDDGTLEVPTGMTTVSGTAAAAILAQWAVNVCDFRDADSVMTPFEYDDDLSDGWDVDGDPTTSAGEEDRKFVWGVERPELLITETYAWEDDSTGGLFIMLHRPWRATAYADGTAAIAGEPIDTLFEEDPTDPENLLDLRKEVSVAGSGTKLPVWRLRIVAGGTTRYVRFNETYDAGGNPPPADFVPASTTNAAELKRAAGSWLLIRAEAASNQATVATDSGNPKADTITINSDAFRAPGMSQPVAGITDPDNWPEPRQCRVYLERLTDPGCEIASGDDATVWPGNPKASDVPDALPQYRVVDEAPVQVVNRSDPPPAIDALGGHAVCENATLVKLLRRTGDVGGKESAFWRNDPIDATGFSPLAAAHFEEVPSQTLGPLTSGVSRWFPWPNRPFVSPVELLLVPRGDSLSMLHDYEAPSASNQKTVGVPIDLSLLFNAVHVPTRFIGIHGTYRGAATAKLDNVDSTYETRTGINTLITTINQLSSFREPGRVNINTIPSADIWNAVVGGPLAEGLLAAGGQNKTRPAVGFTTAPARTLCQALSLSTSPDPLPIQDDYAADAATLRDALARNPMHRFYTANRLANTVTIRSNVFAVWITLRTSVANDPDSVKYHRGFAIIDRSIPVGFIPGKNVNVRDTVRLWRVIE